MGLTARQLRLPDEYDVRARLTPTLLALTPALALAVGVYNVPMKLNYAVIGVFAFFGVFYLLATFAREMGKRQEVRLFRKWGGKPSVQLLRHRNEIIDPVTKEKYHRSLERHLEVKFPSPQEEAADPAAADAKYQAATSWLLEKTRGKKNLPLIFQENVGYGFRRNCFGIRWVAMTIAVFCVGWTLSVASVITTHGVDAQELFSLHLGSAVAVMVGLLNILVWGFFFTERTVRTAAFSFADMLLRASVVLPKKR